jgi:CheY-like chemotaxis protein
VSFLPVPIYKVIVVILLIEDNDETRYLLANFLTKNGREVMEAKDGEEGWELLQRATFDLVITDLVMPKVNGLVLVSRIHARWPKLPIILISGYLSNDAGKSFWTVWPISFRSQLIRPHCYKPLTGFSRTSPGF